MRTLANLAGAKMSNLSEMAENRRFLAVDGRSGRTSITVANQRGSTVQPIRFSRNRPIAARSRMSNLFAPASAAAGPYSRAGQQKERPQ